MPAGRRQQTKLQTRTGLLERKNKTFQCLLSVFTRCSHRHCCQCQPPNSDKVASSGGLNLIFCVRHSLFDGCCVWARKGQLPPYKRQGKSNQKDGEAPKTFFPWSRLAQESPEGVGLWQWPCWLYLSLPCSTWQVFGLHQSHWKLWKGHGWFCASARNNLLPITWDHICFLHGCHAHPGTASAHLSPVTSKCWSQ